MGVMEMHLSEATASQNFREHIENCAKRGWWRELQGIGRKVLQRKVEDNTSVLRGILETEAAEMIGSAVTLPYGLRVGPIIPGKCRVMSSKAKPFMLAFEKPVGYDFAEDK